MKKLCSLLLVALLLLPVFLIHASAASYTVVPGDSLWKIAVKHRIGLSEIKSANPQIKNYDLIYPGQVITIPEKDSATESFEQEVIRLVNEIRRKNGLGTLTYNWELSRVARYKSMDMREKNYFSHTSPTYGSPGQMLKSFGIPYRRYGENIAKGYRSPQAVVDAWMNSPGHRANILDTAFTQIGVGYETQGYYWTQLFIS